MRRILVALAGVVLLCTIAAACAVRDPTEDTSALSFVNDTSHPVTIRWCNDAACRKPYMTDRASPHKATSNGVNYSAGWPLAFAFINPATGKRCVRFIA